MKIGNPFKALSKFELALWIGSVITVTVSFLLLPDKDYLSLTASLIGVTALIFVSKGLVAGQVLTVVFAVFYGIISCFFQYYGEMITYLGMTSPIAVFSVISWLKHPYGGTDEVAVSKVTGKQTAVLAVLTVAVTAAFYFILQALSTANLFFSTVSVATSFVACSLSYLRSPFYAVGYAANDIVLIILWVLAATEDISCVPMVACFGVFFINDMYGFFNWQRMKKRQGAHSREKAELNR